MARTAAAKNSEDFSFSFASSDPESSGNSPSARFPTSFIDRRQLSRGVPPVGQCVAMCLFNSAALFTAVTMATSTFDK